MEKQEMISALSSLAYRPGWTFSAYALSAWEAELLGGDVVLDVACDTVDTNRDCAERGYDVPKTLRWAEPLQSELFHGKEELLGAIFWWLMAIETHEAREFFRVKSEGYAAPFHPHRPEGEAAFERLVR